MSDIEIIKAEIERMHQEAVLAYHDYPTDWLESRIATCVDILTIIDSLTKEKPDKTDELPRYYGN